MPPRCRRLALTTTVQGILAVAMLCGSLLAAEQVEISQNTKRGELTRVQIAFRVGGDLKLVKKDQETRILPMSVEANLIYDEQLLPANSAVRSYRHYQTAEAVIKVDKGGETAKLAPEHRLIGVESSAGHNTLFCPSVALTREQLDLIDIPGNSVLLDGLLPAKPVTIGERWKHSDELMMGLLGLDAVSVCEVQSVLAEADTRLAKVGMAGTIHGAAGGVSTELEIKAKYEFDRALQRVTYFALLIKEKRAVGHVGPGLDIVAKLVMTVTPIEKSPTLEKAIVAKLPQKSTPEITHLTYRSKSGDWHFAYDRSWFTTTEDSSVVVMRRLDRGDLIAQCNVSPLPPAQGQTTTLGDFQSDIERSLGKNFGQFVHASQATNPQGAAVLRVVATGTVSELPIQWIYYLVAHPSGKRVSLAFTVETSLVKDFDDCDRGLVASMQFAIETVQTAAKPQPKR